MSLTFLVGSLPVFAMAVWLVRVLRSDNVARYRWFALLLATFIASFVLLVVLARAASIKSHFYFYTWLTADALQWGLWVAALTEAATRVVERYRGFTRLGNLIIRAGLIVSAISVALLWTLMPSEWTSNLRGFWIVERYVVWGSLTVIALTFAVFATYFRLVPDRNTRVIYAVSTVILLGNLASAAALQYGNGSLMHYSGIALHLICFSWGAWAFRVESEALSPGGPDLSAGATAATRQLESMNEVLTRLLR